MGDSPHIEMEFVSCDLCGGTDHDLLFTKLDSVTGLEFNLVLCRCGMAFVNPAPVEESTPGIYPADYLSDKDIDDPMYLAMLGLLPKPAAGRLLDVGCGKGEFVLHASRVGWEAEGVDLIDWGSPYPVEITVGDLAELPFPRASYDVVTAWAVLEHLRAPSRFFRKIGELLRPGGRFIFVVPNVSAPGMKISCAEDIPRHMWLFSPRTVRAYLSRFGMEAARIRHSGKIYRAYPFGLLRHALLGRSRSERRCAKYENKAVALLRNRQFRSNEVAWFRDVVRELGPVDLALDIADLTLSVCLANLSKLLANYGIITIEAVRTTDEPK